ncbi:MAG: phytanoyl-CoA dioxygenase family protein [Chloroflexota bacterium]
MDREPTDKPLDRSDDGVGQIHPYVINKDMGKPMAPYIDEFPQLNGDGLAIVPPTPEQIYTFDTQGWMLIPEVLSPDEIEEMREWATRLHFEPESIPEHERTPLAGPTQRLIDHPTVVGMLHEFTANPSVSSQECYGFSLAACPLWYRTAPSRRTAGKKESREFVPHNGNGLMRLPGDVHNYDSFPGKSFCPHLRVVWELNPVKHGQGGTLLITGSHKSVFTAPDEIQDPTSSCWTTYECPSGSVLFFAEATTHSATAWTNEENDRIAIGTLYNQVEGGWGPPLSPHPELLAAMPPIRRTLFRGRFVEENVIGADYRRLYPKRP